MSIAPIITFKGGICELDTSVTPNAVKARPTPGYIYLYSEDDLVHFCWRPRSAPIDQPELDLVMVPSDGTFTPYKPTSAQRPSNPERPTNGRIYVLKFASSSQRHLFWLQSRSQHEQGNPAWFSARDLKLGQIVNTLLQGEDIDVQDAIDSLPRGDGGNDGGDDDETMEDVEGTDHSPERRRHGGSGGAGPGATGGDIREEGQESREGGADGGRAAAGSDPSSVVQNFLQSLQSNNSQQETTESPYTTLADLLSTPSTLPFLESADESTLNQLLSSLPESLQLLSKQNNNAPVERINVDKKRNALRKVLRSPQFAQSLGSLTMAIRDGGLPSISDALKIPVQNGGFMRRGGVPLGGGEAVKAFVEGVRQQVEDNQKGDSMETD
ncbi:Adhesion regulating molecule [Trichophyton interdigitale]|uniref:Proteasomal ubiquitin receptor ADRM1-B n=2 Tax=Trichophyton interdigitale TaxID=101480 RepID=A0A9P4YFA1_9EURO|nr:hypothetical protein H101_05107 [Trichophyton interdigitale H6]KAF3892763.1 Proteasomal ubiquitin receptor ADRM1-B [Trichophyton interdigitale]KAG5207097.1 Proteasomal ubiquitin receptor ADRM1-B [Trichophyton interdigitale]KAG8206140.1 Adhesion regulating molecule [Trichophyton interdigitale]KDB27678.1 hypothetical protein H109_00546 [Trichophyton interdigitale MR816]